MSSSGGFSLGFSSGFDVYSGVLPSGLMSVALISHYWLNNFNQCQEINSVWNK